ncbi:MAG TPA: methylated-DNA--[protein]-cysteine S-methyltransferase [Streptosporangiaceae bacterium]|nr:methylated-DNA--[protein]-cysteine S-methyltransferase [Streptosporangiaceae bacterium]
MSVPGATIAGVRELAWGTVSSPVGEISVGCSAAGVSRVRFGPPPSGHEPGDGAASRQLALALAEVSEYFTAGRRTFTLPVDWSGCTQAQRTVLPVLLDSVGFGETVSYGALARRAGLATDGPLPPARVVGQIMGSNPCPVIVPCHRVVAGDGLGGFSGGTGVEVKRWLLIFEGALPPTLDWDPAGPMAGLR